MIDPVVRHLVLMQYDITSRFEYFPLEFGRRSVKLLIKCLFSGYCAKLHTAHRIIITKSSFCFIIKIHNLQKGAKFGIIEQSGRN